jgi:hypothetical protein
MLDYKRLEANSLLIKSGWTPSHKGIWKERLAHLDMRFPPQVPVDTIFESARDIVDALDGIRIQNQCAELGVGLSCDAIEFDFFHYDAFVYPQLEIVCSQIGKRAVYIGIGYDILGDWLVDEAGMIYFQNEIRHTLSPFSKSIYDFLENDIYRCADLIR